MMLVLPYVFRDFVLQSEVDSIQGNLLTDTFEFFSSVMGFASMLNSILICAACIIVGTTADVSQDIRDLADMYCHDTVAFPPVESGDITLITNFMGGTNYFESILYDHACGDVPACAQKYQTALIKALVRAGVGIILAIATVLLFLLLAPCACCRCCRQCPLWCCWSERLSPHNMGRKTKVFLISILLIFIGALAADIVYALRFKPKINHGMDGFMCELFTFGSDILNGAPGKTADRSFLGADGMVTAVQDLDSMMSADSSTLQSVLTIVDSTSAISTAVATFLTHLDFTNTILSDPTNLAVGFYECVFCTSCCTVGANQEPSLVQQASASIEQSLASALVSARNTVREKLSGDGLSSIRDSIASTKTMVSDYRSQLSDAVRNGLVDKEPLLQSTRSGIDTATTSVVASMALPTILLVIAVTFGIFRSTLTSYTSTRTRLRNPCIASCGWCTTFLYAFIVFFIAGIIGIVSYVAGSACGVIGDIDTFAARGLFRVGGDNTQIRSLITTCLETTGSGDLLSSVTTGGGSSASGILNISAQVDAAFNTLNDFAPSPFSTTPGISDFLTAMHDVGALYLIPASVVSTILSDPQFAPSAQLLAAIGGSDAFTTLAVEGLSGVPQCADTTVMNGGISTTLKGAETFATDLLSGGVDIGAAGSVCPSDFFTLTPPDASLADPFTEFMRWKMDVLSHRFKCDTLVVTEGADGEVSTEVTPGECSWDEWVVYLDTLQQTLSAAAVAVDVAQTSTFTEISTNLRALVKESILPRIETVINGTDCSFMGARLHGVHDQLCYRGLAGVVGSMYTWLVFGGLCLIAVLIEFVIWRNLKDNLSVWTQLKREGLLREDDGTGRQPGGGRLVHIGSVDSSGVTLVQQPHVMYQPQQVEMVQISPYGQPFRNQEPGSVVVMPGSSVGSSASMMIPSTQYQSSVIVQTPYQGNTVFYPSQT